MPRFVAFLRAINLGGTRAVRMDSLREIFESLGFLDVQTFIASGNVVFETRTKRGKAIERQTEKKLRQALGFDVGVFVRTDAELIEITKYKPFPKSKIDAFTACNIIFLSDALDEKMIGKVEALRTKTDELRVRGREIYWLRRKVPGAAFSTVPLEKTLGRPFTVRACNTVNRIVAKFDSTA